MPRTLYLTVELPYFPGQAGVMALHIGHLNAQGSLGLVGPRYPHQPEAPLQKLRETVAHSYWYPEPPRPGPIPMPEPSTRSVDWLKHLPRWIKVRLLRRLTGLDRFSEDALAWRRVFVNHLAPKLLEALQDGRWSAVLMSQSVSASWLPFLPATLARCVYFHDIRSDYLRRAPGGFRRRDLARIEHEEKQAAAKCDGMAFVSELDEARAKTLLAPAGPTAVAPLCLDLDYFRFEPAAADAPPVVLFTGHLSHPPNVDAVLYFLRSIWPQIAAEVPGAQCRIVGAHPADAVVAAARAVGVELVANVPDIRPYFRAARVYVVPMRFGGGVRNKILEAWAMGVPVVTTTMGAEGIPAQDGGNCWLRDTPADFAAQVVALLRAPVPTPVVAAGRTQVEQQHSSAASSPRLAALLATATQRKRQSPPKVLYDLRWLQPGKVGGVEQMTHELVDELASFDREFEYRFFGPERNCQRWRFPAGFKHQFVSTDGPAERRRAWRDACIERLTAELGEASLTSPETRALELYTRLDFTVVHGLPCYVHPDLRRFPSVVTMHDLQHLHLPDLFTPEDIAHRENHYRESCRLADHVICISEFTRQDVHRRYGVPLEKLTTIWNLPPQPPAERPGAGHDQRLLAAMELRTPFLFYPAQPWLHKNHATLIQAFQAALPALPAECRLVLTGQPFPEGHPALALLREPALRGRVLHLGYRSREEIAALYRHATALVFASRFEGFGIPVLEAMQRDCPVVCGEHTSLPEIAGSAVRYADIASTEKLAAAMVEIVRDEALRARLRLAGRANLARFDRRQLAEKHRAIYAAVHARHFS